MTDNRISLCMIVRDDSATLPALLEKVRPHVDEAILIDTGSTDETPSIARHYATHFETFLGCNDPATEAIEDFALARQFALEKASCGWHLWLDGDDDFQGAENLRQLTNRPEESVQYLVPYEYTHDAAGRVTCLHWRENLVKPRDKCRWQIPVHEVLIPSIPMQVIEPTNLIRRIHKKHLSKRAPDPDRNLRILTKYIARVGETDVRALYYYGVELHHAGRIGDAIRVLRRYVQLAGWTDEKCLAQLELSRIYHYKVGYQREAISWAMEAMITKSWPEPYFMLCRAFHALASSGVDAEYNAKRALHWGERGLKEPDTQTVLFVNPMERFEIQHYMSELYVRSNQMERARDSVNAGLQGMPDDQLLQRRALILEDFFNKNTLIRAAERARQLTDTLRQTDAFDAGQWAAVGSAVGQFLEIATPQLVAPPVYREVEPQPVADGCLDIAFYLGQAFERWTPVTLSQTGMGGSETMAWELAKRLRKIGHRVRCFVDCHPEQEGIYEGVEWLQSSKYVGTRCDVLIAERRPDAVNDEAQLTAGCRVLHIHDVHVGHFTKVQALRFDAIFALSQWHKRYLLEVYGAQAPHPICQLHPDDITVTRNGIDFARFDAEAPRNPKRVVYSSSPDRGLTTLLEMWPEILKEEPEAELHCFYGLDGWEKALAMNPQHGEGHPVHQAFLSATALRRLKHQLRTVPRVTMHGRVNQETLAREFLQSGVWAYPTWFCCHGDTRISVPGDHRGGAPTVRIKDMVGKSGFPVYAFNEAENRFEIRTALRVWETKIAEELVALELDSGETLKVTPDHKVLTFDGDWVEAGTLKEGDSLRALHYRYNVAIRDGNGRWTSEHRLVGEWKEGRPLRRDEHVDHSDPIRLDNRPEALTVMTASEHFSKTHKGKRLSKKHIAKKAEILRAAMRAKDPELLRSSGDRLRAALTTKLSAMSPAALATWKADKARKRNETVRRKSAEDPAYAARLLASSIRGLDKGRQARWGATGDDRAGRNHKVVRVTRITEPTPVYDMEVEGLHNFVADGIVVHNCETNCITAAEAQAAGLYIVTTPVAALNETVSDRGTRIPGGWEQNAATATERKEFVQAVVKAIRGEGQRWTREALATYARENFGLDSLAAEWDVMLRGLHARTVEKVVRAFRG